MKLFNPKCKKRLSRNVPNINKNNKQQLQIGIDWAHPSPQLRTRQHLADSSKWLMHINFETLKLHFSSNSSKWSFLVFSSRCTTENYLSLATKILCLSRTCWMSFDVGSERKATCNLLDGGFSHLKWRGQMFDKILGPWWYNILHPWKTMEKKKNRPTFWVKSVLRTPRSTDIWSLVLCHVKHRPSCRARLATFSRFFGVKYRRTGCWFNWTSQFATSSHGFDHSAVKDIICKSICANMS